MTRARKGETVKLTTVAQMYRVVIEPIGEQITVDNSRAVGHLVQQYGLGRLSTEAFWVVAYDGGRNVRQIFQVAQGSFHEVMVSVPALLSAVLIAGADRFVVAHNHPNGAMFPTLPDIELTRQIASGAAQVGLYFEDHLIVGPTEDAIYSMVEAGRLIPPPGIAQMAATGRAGEPAADVVKAPKPYSIFLEHDEFLVRK